MIELVLTIAFTYFAAKADSEILNRGDFIYSHTSRFWMRNVFFVAVADKSSLEGFILTLAASILLFSTAFDKVLNYLRKKPLFYLGTTAKWDLFWRERMTAYKVFTYLALIVSITLFVIKAVIFI